MDGTARALKGRYESKCPACKRNLLSLLLQDDRYHLDFSSCVYLYRQLELAFHLHCHPVPVTSSHCITTVSATLRGIDSFWGLSLRRRRMSHESKNTLKHSVKLVKLQKCISSYRKDVSVSRGTTWKVTVSSGCYKQTLQGIMRNPLLATKTKFWIWHWFQFLQN